MKSTKYIFEGQKFLVKGKIVEAVQRLKKGDSDADIFKSLGVDITQLPGIVLGMTDSIIEVQRTVGASELTATNGWFYQAKWLRRVPFKVGDRIVRAAPVGKYTNKQCSLDFTCSAQDVMATAVLVVTKVGSDVDGYGTAKYNKNTIEVRRDDNHPCWGPFKEVNVDSRLFRHLPLLGE